MCVDICVCLCVCVICFSVGGCGYVYLCAMFQCSSVCMTCNPMALQ